MPLYHDRSEAGRLLASYLYEFENRGDVLVLALPKGGVPVAAEVASALAAPLEVMVVRKIGVPWNPEFAVGAIASGGMQVLDTDTMNQLGLSMDSLAPVIEAERKELARRERHYRQGRPFPDLEGQVVILVDDGLATGATMQAAVMALRSRAPSLIVVAVPVASRSALVRLDRFVDRMICLATPEPFYGVGAWYADFEQTTDEEVLSLLARSELPLLTGGSGSTVRQSRSGGVTARARARRSVGR